MDTATSITLIERLRDSSDHQAWTRFIEIYTPLIFHWARRMGLRQHDATDLVQDVLTLIVQKLPAFAYDPQKSFRGWLRTVTLNKWREQQRRRSVALVQAGDDDLADVEDSEASEKFWTIEFQQLLVGRVMELMKATSHLQSWTACWQLVVEGRAAAEVALDLGMTKAAVYMAKSRVLKQLREELAGLPE